MFIGPRSFIRAAFFVSFVGSVGSLTACALHVDGLDSELDFRHKDASPPDEETSPTPGADGGADCPKCGGTIGVDAGTTDPDDSADASASVGVDSGVDWSADGGFGWVGVDSGVHSGSDGGAPAHKR